MAEKSPAVDPSSWPPLHKVRPELSVVSKLLFSKVESNSVQAITVYGALSNSPHLMSVMKISISRAIVIHNILCLVYLFLKQTLQGGGAHGGAELF